MIRVLFCQRERRRLMHGAMQSFLGHIRDTCMSFANGLFRVDPKAWDGAHDGDQRHITGSRGSAEPRTRGRQGSMQCG